MAIVAEMRGFEIEHEPEGWPAVRMRQVSALCDEIDRLRRIEAAAKNLVAQRGRHNTEIAYRRLAGVLQGPSNAGPLDELVRRHDRQRGKTWKRRGQEEACA